MNVWIDTATLAGACPLFGLSPLDRLLRSLSKLDVSGVVLSGPAAAHGPVPRLSIETVADDRPLGTRLAAALRERGEPLLVIAGGTAVDPRLLALLLSRLEPAIVIRGEGAERAAIAVLPVAAAAALDPAETSLLDLCDGLAARGTIPLLPREATSGFITKLRRDLDFWLFNVPDERSRRRREWWMFRSNYKGSTDILTAYVYPPFVWVLTKLSTRIGLHPNVITAASIILTVAAVPLFAWGQFAWGFACAVGMSILDSVDGKVARLTLTDSRIGNVLDHGLDLVHPPFWYGGLAIGLGAKNWGDPLTQAAILLVVVYILDRLVLRTAKRRFKRGLHAMTPLDGKVRLIIARRNTNMLIMAAALLLGAGETGFYVITFWQTATLVWHAVRTAMLQPLTALQPHPK